MKTSHRKRGDLSPISRAITTLRILRLRTSWADSSRHDIAEVGCPACSGPVSEDPCNTVDSASRSGPLKATPGNSNEATLTCHPRSARMSKRISHSPSGISSRKREREVDDGSEMYFWFVLSYISSARGFVHDWREPGDACLSSSTLTWTGGSLPWTRCQSSRKVHTG